MWTDLNGLTHGRYIPSSRFDHATHHAVTTLAMSPEGEILPLTGYAADVGFPDLGAVPIADDPAPRLGARHRRRHLRAARRRRRAAAAVPTRRARPGRRRVAGPRLRAAARVRARAVPPRARRRPPSVAGSRPAATATGCTASVSAATRPVSPSSYFDTVEAMDIELEGVLTEFSPGPARGQPRLRPGARRRRRRPAGQGDDPRGRRPPRLPGDVHGPAPRHVGRVRAARQHVAGARVGRGQRAARPDRPEGLSSLAHQAIGGLLQHHEAVAGLSAPLVNSYKRLMPGLIAGYWANWGLDNRFSTYRVPAERGAATRIENRMPCATASPYLAAAATLNAALLGAVDGLDCGDPQIGDADAAPNTDRHTPHTLAEALDAVEADTVLGRGDGSRAGDAPTSPCAATRSPAGRRPARRGTPSRSRPGSSTATSRTTDAPPRPSAPQRAGTQHTVRRDTRTRRGSPSSGPRRTFRSVPTIETATGPVDSAELGRVLMHEHVFIISPEMKDNVPEDWGDEEHRLDDAAQAAVGAQGERHRRHPRPDGARARSLHPAHRHARRRGST